LISVALVNISGRKRANDIQPSKPTTFGNFKTVTDNIVDLVEFIPVTEGNRAENALIWLDNGFDPGRFGAADPFDQATWTILHNEHGVYS
jgi:hypothetical protein